MPVRKKTWSEKKGIDLGAGTGRGIHSWTEGVMKRPTARQVAELDISHGFHASEERWWFIPKHQIRHLISQGKRAIRKEAA